MATPMNWLTFTHTLLYSQLLVRIPYPEYSFAGQTIIVTGSNTGLGLEAARHLVRLGASKVILAVRTISKGEAAAENILISTKATKDSVEVWSLDLSNHDSIISFAKRAEKLERLDAVIQNAGILSAEMKMIDGTEAHIAVNVIGATLLGLLMVPKLRETGKKFKTRTRLSFVGSDMQYIAAFKEANTVDSIFSALNSKEESHMGDRYPTSKLILLYAVREIVTRCPVSLDSNVIINVTTPGACRSDIFRDEKSWIGSLIQEIMFKIFARTSKVGGAILVDGVRPDLGIEVHGAFLMDCKVAKNGSNVDSVKGQELARRCNLELFERLEEISPGVTKILG